MSALEFVIVVLVLAWLFGAFAIGGSLIHLLLVVALVAIVVRLINGRSV